MHEQPKMDKYALQKMVRLARLKVSLALSLFMVAPMLMGAGITQTNTYQQGLGAGADTSTTSGSAAVGAGTIGNSVNLQNFFRAIALLKTRTTTSNSFRLCSFGDSLTTYDYSPQRVMFETMGNRYGVQSANRLDPWYSPGWNSTTATHLYGGPDTIGWDYWLLTNTIGITLTNGLDSAGNFSVVGYDFLFYRCPTGGTFKVYSSGTLKLTLQGSNNVSGWTRTNIYVGANIASSYISFTNFTGTNRIFCVVPRSSYNPGRDALEFDYVGKGGISLAQFAGVTSNNLYTLWKALNPDVWAFIMKHGGDTTSDNLRKVVRPLTNACPNCVPLFFSAPATPQEDDSTANSTIRQFCSDYGFMYADLASQAPATNKMTTSDWLVDSLHPSTTAYIACLRPFHAYWGLDYPQPANEGRRIDRLFLNLPVNTAYTTDATIPFSVSSKNSGGRFDLYFWDANNVTFVKLSNYQVLMGDTDSTYLFSPGSQSAHGRIVFMANQYNGNQVYAGQFATNFPGGGFNVGTNQTPSVASGVINAEQGYSIGGSAGLTTNVVVGGVTLVIKGGVLTGVQ